MNLNHKQIDSFQQQGFLVLENFVSEPQCEALRQCANKLVEEFDPG